MLFNAFVIIIHIHGFSAVSESLDSAMFHNHENSAELPISMEMKQQNEHKQMDCVIDPLHTAKETNCVETMFYV